MICPHCHARIGCERLGVHLSPLKARILDLIKAAGEVGISARQVSNEVYRDLPARRPNTVGVHVYQINELLEDTGAKIKSDGRGPLARWYLQQARRLRS